MRIPYRYAAPWLGFWGFLSERSMERWDRMSDEVDARTYGSDKLLSDVLEFWNDVTCGWLAALRSGGDLPRVLFLLTRDTQTDCKELRLFLPSLPHGNPALTHLLPVDPAGPSQINATHCRLCLSSRRQLLTIHLEGLPPVPLSAGTYHGMIHIADEPVALLFIKVES